MTPNFKHIPVLLSETIDGLMVKSGEKYIDATLGGAGHAEEILKRGGLVLGIDQDKDALAFVKDRFESYISDNKLILVHGNFEAIGKISHDHSFKKVKGILMDLGVSSYQLDSSGRGFSIKNDEVLDMRMNEDNPLTARDVVNSYSFDRLTEIFYLYGEEHNAKKIAEAICDRRKKSPITTTKELAALVERVPHKSEDIHPATRVFQAIRIEVNQELASLKTALEQALEVLDHEGRLAVISFHSLEDRIVKQTFEKEKRQGKGNVITKKPLIATEGERAINRRARSAKLRIFEKK